MSSVEKYAIVELPDGTFIVRNNETWGKTHAGYFASRDEADAELAAIEARDEQP